MAGGVREECKPDGRDGEGEAERALVQAILLRAAGAVGNADIVGWVLDRYKHLDLVRLHASGGPTRVTPLHVACRNGHLAVVKALVAAGARLNVATKEGVLPLHLAAQCNRGGAGLDVLNYLRSLSPAVDVSACDGNQQTVLHHAARAGAGSKVLVLLLAWLDSAAASKSKGGVRGRVSKGRQAGGGTASSPAAGAIRVMSMRDVWGRTPLHWLCVAKSLPFWRDRERACLDPHEFETKGKGLTLEERSGRHRAAINGHAIEVQRLLDAGADVSVRDAAGESALDMAVCLVRHCDGACLLVAIPNLMFHSTIPQLLPLAC